MEDKEQMMQIVLNVGLNVRGQEPPEQEQETLDLIEPIYYFIGEGVDDKLIERTVICVINIKYGEIQSTLEQYCKLLNQDCIAYSGSRVNGLVFSPTYTGKKYKFDPAYFIQLTRTGVTKAGI